MVICWPATLVFQEDTVEAESFHKTQLRSVYEDKIWAYDLTFPVEAINALIIHPNNHETLLRLAIILPLYK